MGYEFEFRLMLLRLTELTNCRFFFFSNKRVDEGKLFIIAVTVNILKLGNNYEEN